MDTPYGSYREGSSCVWNTAFGPAAAESKCTAAIDPVRCDLGIENINAGLATVIQELRDAQPDSIILSDIHVNRGQDHRECG